MTDDYDPNGGVEPTPGFAEEIQGALDSATTPARPQSAPDQSAAEIEAIKQRWRTESGQQPETQFNQTVGTSPLAQDLEQSGWFAQQEAQHAADNAAAHERDRQDAIRESTRAAQPPETVPTWDDIAEITGSPWWSGTTGQPRPVSPSDVEFAVGEQSWGQRMERFWRGAQSLLQDQIARRAERNRIEQEVLSRTPPTGEDPIHAWAQRRVATNIAQEQQRQTAAEEIAGGTRAGPTTGLPLNLARRTGHGILDGVVANTIKGIAYSSQYLRGEPLSQTAETGIYHVGQIISDWATKLFPDDTARQYEFSGQLAEGFGSMVGFMGPGAAVNILVRGGPKTIALIGGGSAAVTGAFTQAGSITDDAVRAMREGRPVDGRLITEENLRSAYLWSIPGGLSEGLPIAHLFTGHSGAWMRAILAQAFEEGGQEFGQDVLENVVARANYDDKREWDDNAWQGMLVGGVLGGVMQGGPQGIIRTLRSVASAEPWWKTSTSAYAARARARDAAAREELRNAAQVTRQWQIDAIDAMERGTPVNSASPAGNLLSTEAQRADWISKFRNGTSEQRTRFREELVRDMAATDALRAGATASPQQTGEGELAVGAIVYPIATDGTRASEPATVLHMWEERSGTRYARVQLADGTDTFFPTNRLVMAGPQEGLAREARVHGGGVRTDITPAPAPAPETAAPPPQAPSTQDLRTSLEQQFRAMLPGDVGVRLADHLRGFGLSADEIVNTPSFFNDRWLLNVALSPGEDTAKVKGFHGIAAHILRGYGDTGLYSPQEWTLLVNTAKSAGMQAELETARTSAGNESMWSAYTRAYAPHGPTRQTELLDQELVGRMAEKWASGTSFGAMTDGLLARIAKFLAAIRNATRGLGFQTADDVLRRVTSGEVARRSGVSPQFAGVAAQNGFGAAVVFRRKTR
jgi:hypothetical protein